MVLPYTVCWQHDTLEREARQRPHRKITFLPRRNPKHGRKTRLALAAPHTCVRGSPTLIVTYRKYEDEEEEEEGGRKEDKMYID